MMTYMQCHNNKFKMHLFSHRSLSMYVSAPHTFNLTCNHPLTCMEEVTVIHVTTMTVSYIVHTLFIAPRCIYLVFVGILVYNKIGKHNLSD